MIENLIGSIIGSILLIIVTKYLEKKTFIENENFYRNSSINSFIINVPKSYFLIYGASIFICSLIFIFGFVVGILEKAQDFEYLGIFLIILIFDLLSIYAYFYYLNWKLKVDNNIILQRLLKKDLNFEFENISQVEIKGEKVRVTLKDGFKFKFETDYNCYELFIKKLYVNRVTVILRD